MFQKLTELQEQFQNWNENRKSFNTRMDNWKRAYQHRCGLNYIHDGSGEEGQRHQQEADGSIYDHCDESWYLFTGGIYSHIEPEKIPSENEPDAEQQYNEAIANLLRICDTHGKTPLDAWRKIEQLKKQEYKGCSIGSPGCMR